MPTGVYPRVTVMALCHPKRKHRSLGLCNSCYNKFRMQLGDNRKKKSEGNKRWYKRNQEKVKARTSANYRKNKKKYKETMRAWRKAHPEANILKHAKRRARKMKTGGEFTRKEWLSLCKKYDYRCLRCNKRKPLTADHVVPVSKGGTSNIDNIQPLCRECNSIKHTKSTDYRKKRRRSYV